MDCSSANLAAPFGVAKRGQNRRQRRARFKGDHKPENASSVGGVFHRGWINLKTAVAGRDTHGILVECERGEDSAVAEYRKALDLDLPANLREIFQRQATDIKAAHDRIKEMRDAAAPTR